MKHTKKTMLFLTLTTALAASSFVATSRAAIETPDYKVVRTDNKIEIRDYPALTVATTTMEGDEMNRGFGRLFQFITGSNDKSEKIAMTAPVLIDTAKPEKKMSFIVPKDIAAKGVPKPKEGSVTLRKLEAARFAVLRFSGGRTSENEKTAIEKLKEWLVAQKLVGRDDPVFAYYDPPWTPNFMRRNEVMIRIDKPRS
jgi:DNA gyrase inhibitor GyrI